MKKIPLILLAVAFAVSNAVAQTNNSGADQPATTGGDQKPKDDKAPAKQDPGIRKLSRRERKDRIKNLSDKYREFLQDVEPIMQDSELDTFLLLETDPQRDIYIADFWRRRDKLQGTTNHTFRDQYYERLETVKEKFRNVSSDPGRIYLIHGEPAEIIESDCRLLVPIQVWKYLYIPNLGHNVRFVFFQNRFGSDWRLWIPVGI